MKLLDLFSGVGGFSLAAHWAGIETVAFCECDRYARAVLRKQWPGVPLYDDVRTLTVDTLRRDGIERVDIITGGFPCQDVSQAGRGAGITGERSRLWFQFRRLISECVPYWVVVENSPALRLRGADRVLEGLEALDYACWAIVVGAHDVGSPQLRRRAFIVACHQDRVRELILAYADGGGGTPRAKRAEWKAWSDPRGRSSGTVLADADGAGRLEQCSAVSIQPACSAPQRASSGFADVQPRRATITGMGGNAHGLPSRVDGYRWPARPGEAQFPEEPARLTRRFPLRTLRLKSLGNAVVPQVVFPMLSWIAEMEACNA